MFVGNGDVALPSPKADGKVRVKDTIAGKDAETDENLNENGNENEQENENENAHDSSAASTPLSDHHDLEPLPDRGQISVSYTRFNKKHDPFVAAVSDEAYIPPHHSLTLASRATRLGQSLYHAGARSFHHHSHNNNNKGKSIGYNTQNAHAPKRTAPAKPQHTRMQSTATIGEASERASVRTVVSVHLPRWMNDFTARRSRQQSIMPLLSFCNPWSSHHPPGIATALQGGLRWGLPKGYVEGGRHTSRYRSRGRTLSQTEQDRKDLDVHVVAPTWKSQERDEARCKENIRITWLGHATTLVQLPNGINILFDPIFVHRASPSQSAGPHRFTKPPCKIEELPDIDIVCISHNHYDHLSWECMKKLRKRQKLRGGLKVFCALGNVGFFREAGFAEEDVCEMDWWDKAKVERSGITGDLELVCTPAQHGSGRSGGDQNISLWCSWLICYKQNEPSPKPQHRIFFAGDTGLRSRTSSRRRRSDYPVCPVFREISLKFGVVHVCLLPISVGSSLSYFRSWDPFPRRFSPFPRVESTMTSAIHMDAEDAAECHAIMSLANDRQENSGDSAPTHSKRMTDSNKRRENQGSNNAIANSTLLKSSSVNGGFSGTTSIAVHFGTFVRNEEQTRADVRQLRAACQERRIAFIRPTENVEPATIDEDDKHSSDTNAAQKQTPSAKNNQSSSSEAGRFLVTHQGQTVFIPLLSE